MPRHSCSCTLRPLMWALLAALLAAAHPRSSADGSSAALRVTHRLDGVLLAGVVLLQRQHRVHLAEDGALHGARSSSSERLRRLQLARSCSPCCSRRCSACRNKPQLTVSVLYASARCAPSPKPRKACAGAALSRPATRAAAAPAASVSRREVLSACQRQPQTGLRVRAGREHIGSRSCAARRSFTRRSLIVDPSPESRVRSRRRGDC